VLDSLYVIETAMQHFFLRAEMGKNAGRKKEEVDEAGVIDLRALPVPGGGIANQGAPGGDQLGVNGE
jgi:hypothetical protein